MDSPFWGGLLHMIEYKYLIVGGGMAAGAAAEGIRKTDAAGKIAIVGLEPDPPYNRPPLSKALWKGDSIDSIWRKTNELKVDLRLSARVEKIDPVSKEVIDQHQNRIKWDKLLIATGGTPRTFDFGNDEIIYYRTVGDYRRLRSWADSRQRFAIIGGGFIGSEIAAALKMNGKDVAMIFPGEGICNRVFPPSLAQYLMEYYQGKGVELHPGTRVTGIEKRGAQQIIKTSNKELPVDGVIAGIGIEPNTKLAQEAGLHVENGIIVDEQLRTSHPDIYAAGDVASFFNPALKKRMRVEHEDNANSMGELAGKNMAGQKESYTHLPMFYSDLFELGYEAVGDLDSRLETFIDWKEPYKEGVIYYLSEGRVRGVLLWNVWGKVDAARELISQPGPYNASNLKGRF
jgi:NADPH-dependent 2,4-dienoyl-CoA reductase/sulfur reductase-like enzyme